MKTDYTTQMERLEARLAVVETEHLDIDDLLTESIQKLLGLLEVYRRVGIEGKRDIIGSMYPEKLSFDGNVVRTTRVNEIASHIYHINNQLQAKKNKDKSE